MELIKYFIDLLLHLDVHLAQLTASMGLWTYVVLFLIIFCETGLVVTPILPGDSLLFATGALAALEGSFINVWMMLALLIIAAVLGDGVNYAIGKWMGPKVFTERERKWLKKDYLLRTQAFYEKHGGKTIVFARFAPIIRTFAPFVAGIARMPYSNFVIYNVVGGVLWVASFLLAGYWFGNIPAIKTNFHIVVVAIVIISVLPMVFEFIKGYRAKNQKNPI